MNISTIINDNNILNQKYIKQWVQWKIIILTFELNTGKGFFKTLERIEILLLLIGVFINVN